jgi:flagellar hook-length control protein FliK
LNRTARDGGLREAGLKDAGLIPVAGSADLSLADSDPADLAFSDVRPGEGRGAADPAGPRADTLPRATAAQLAEVARRLADGPVEVSLSPEELGRVRLSLHGNEAQMTVQIMAERPETLDLLRRHIDLLAAELRQQGFTDLTFSFSGGGAGGSGGAEQAETGAGSGTAGEQLQPNGLAGRQIPAPDRRANAALSGTGLDLRL